MPFPPWIWQTHRATPGRRASKAPTAAMLLSAVASLPVCSAMLAACCRKFTVCHCFLLFKVKPAASTPMHFHHDYSQQRPMSLRARPGPPCQAAARCTRPSTSMHDVHMDGHMCHAYTHYTSQSQISQAPSLVRVRGYASHSTKVRLDGKGIQLSSPTAKIKP